MKTVGEIIDLSAKFLEERKVERPKRSAEELLAHLLKCKKMDLYLQYDRPMLETELSLLRELVKRAAAGEPLEYVMGEVEFFGAKIKTDRRALIPRPETEILAEFIANKVSQGILWDICTGTGCIGISLKKKHPALQVTLSDISEDTLNLARENSVGMDIEIVQGDLLTPFAGKRADVVVCNPPYISESEFLNLDVSVRDFEPKRALVGGVKGTEFYERLARELPPILNSQAMVFLEIGSTQGELVKQIFHDPIWKTRELLKDWAGLDRFFFLEKQ